MLGIIAGGVVAGMLHPSPALAAPAPTWPGSSWTTLTPLAAGFNQSLFTKAVNYAKSKGGSGFVARYGYQVGTWGSAAQTYDVKSATKGVGSMLVALALQDGRFQLGDQALSRLNPEFGVPPSANGNTNNGWRTAITLQHLLYNSSWFDEEGGFEPLLFPPGSYYLYSNCGANWLADICTVSYGADLLSVLKQRIATPIGIASSDLTWRNNSYRPTTLRGLKRREFGSGLYVTARAFARIGHLLLRNGAWQTGPLVPAAYLAGAEHSRPELAGLLDFETGQPSDLRHYNEYFENNDDGSYPSLPPDVFFFWGKYNNHVFVVPSLDMVVVRIGTQGLGDTFGSVDTLLGNFVRAATTANNGGGNNGGGNTGSNANARLSTNGLGASTAAGGRPLTPALQRHLNRRGPVDRFD